jgi:muconolactone delta-isomerase
MEFLVEFEVEVPSGTPASEVERRTRAEESAAARLVDEGHLLRLWRRTAGADDASAIGLYASDSEAQRDRHHARYPRHQHRLTSNSTTWSL